MHLKIIYYGNAAWIAMYLLLQPITSNVLSIALLLSFVFLVVITLFALISPLITNRSMIELNRENRTIDQSQIKRLESKLLKIEEYNTVLLRQNLELKGENQQKALDLQLAYDHIVRLEETVRAFENPNLR